MKESDIRPKELMDEYIALSLRDAQSMDRTQFVEISCPGCGGLDLHPKFLKENFEYKQCNLCQSVFCSPRPSNNTLNSFYEKSASSAYWAKVFFPQVAEARREKLFRPKAQKIAELVNRTGLKKELKICDVGAGYGIFLEELRQALPGALLHAIEPGRELAEVCRKKGFETLEASAENSEKWAGRFDLVISSEVIEHVFSPQDFLQALGQLAKPDGIVLITGLGYEGFDILSLQENSKSVSPPHHINFLSIKGFDFLFRRANLHTRAIWTPGVLDVDIVLGSELAPEFLKVMASRPKALEEFQELLSRHCMSSHVWAMASPQKHQS